MFLQEPGEAILPLVCDKTCLPPIDCIDVSPDVAREGVVFYTAVVKQPPAGQPAHIIFQVYIDGQPHEKKVEDLVLPALVVQGPDGKDLLLSQNAGVFIQLSVTLPPGLHKIAVHGGAFQNYQKNATVTISQRKLSFLPLTPVSGN